MRRIDLATASSSAIERVVLDAGPLGRISNPNLHADVAEWLKQVVRAEIRLFISEVADFEVRRNLILHGKTKSVKRLDELKEVFGFIPITTPIMLHAAELWAAARRRGRPTADLKALDCDVILAAQAIEHEAVVATENEGHLSQFVATYFWKDIIA